MLPAVTAPLRFGLAPIMGNGRQYIPWIHWADMVRILVHGVEDLPAGLYNAVAPEPATQAAFMRTLRKARKGIALPVPAFAFLLRLMLGEMSQTVLGSQRVRADKILAAGFEPRFPTLADALQDLA